MKIKFLIFLFILCFLLQGYTYEYKVPVLDPANNAASHNSQGIMYMEMGFYSTAMSEFQIAISLNPDSPASAAYYNNLGILFLKFNMINEAQECFTKAISLNHVFLEYHTNLIKTYEKSGCLNAKLNEYLNQISKNNKNSDAYFMAGLIYAQMGQNEQAIKYLKRFTTLEKNQVLARGIKQKISELQANK